MGKVFFISDTHFGHDKIIRFDLRPYRDIEHMWYSMRDAWNEKVNDDDLVYILGDMFWTRDPKEATRMLKQLNARKRLVKGNHCQFLSNSTVKNEFETIRDIDEVKVGDKRLILCHYPIMSWKDMQGKNDSRDLATIHLHGHVHRKREYYAYLKCLEIMNFGNKVPLKAYNVGACLPWINYVPRTLEEIERGYARWEDVIKEEMKNFLKEDWSD